MAVTPVRPGPSEPATRLEWPREQGGPKPEADVIYGSCRPPHNDQRHPVREACTESTPVLVLNQP